MTFKRKGTKLSEETPEESKDKKQQEDPNSMQAMMQAHEQMRCISLYGDVDEETAAETVAGFLTLNHMRTGETPEENAIELVISTYGGCSDDMFSIYDIMSMVKRDNVIRTVGIGKVMSAGVLLLAAGTKGERYIGRNCRVMLHAVSAGHHGMLHNLENELEEVRKLQDLYIENLISVTNLTKRQIKTFLRKKSNIYFSAEDAIKHGIADKILE